MSKGDQLIGGLKRSLGARAPAEALRSEWIGPRAGAQLRDSAVKSVLIAIVFIMAYIAFRFDLRFAPGGILALVHDSIGTVGVLILLKKELDLTSVAANLQSQTFRSFEIYIVVALIYLALAMAFSALFRFVYRLALDYPDRR
jgi:preprotein translocase subunit SecF